MSQYKKIPKAAPQATTAQAVFVPPQPSAPLRSMDQERAEFALTKIQAILGGADKSIRWKCAATSTTCPPLSA